MTDGGKHGPDGHVPGEALFRLLLLLHPPEFRERYREEMLDTLRDGWRAEAAGQGASAAVAFWLRTLRGTLRAAAGQQLGRVGTTRVGEERMGEWLQDLRFAARALLRRPAFGALVIVTFALGMGANTAVFSVLHGVLLSPLPYDAAGRMVRLYAVEETEPDDLAHMPGMAFIELRERVSSLELTALYNHQEEQADLTDGGRPERVRMLRVASGYFRLLGVAPLAGRGFAPDEERDSVFVAVVSQDVWERYLDGDPDAVGRAAITLEGVPYTVVGVMPASFEDPLDEGVDVWVPQNLQRGGENNFDNQYLTVLGRLRDDVTLEQARGEVTAVSRRFGELDERAEGRRSHVVPLHEDVVGGSGALLWLVMAAAGCLLLIACVNVASLFLARGASLRGELAIRSALGSGRGRLVRQVLLESVLLSALGGAAGLLLGTVLLQALLAVAPPDLPRLGDLAVDAPVVLYGAVLSLVAGLLLGLVPALRHSAPERAGGLADELRRSGAGDPRQRLRSALVVSEVGLALVLLIGAGILLRSFQALRSVELGFEEAGVETFEMHLPDGRYADPAERARFHGALLERIAALPGIAHAGAISDLPATGDRFRWGTGLSDASGNRDTDTFIGANQRAVEGDYFEALGIPLLRGRTFGPGDDAESIHVVVVNETLVRRLWLDRDLDRALGEEIWYGPWRARVVGVVGDAAIGVRGETAPKIYHAHVQFAANRNWPMKYVVAAERPVPELAAAVRRELATLDPFLVAPEIRTLARVVGRGVARERFATLLLGVFATVAALLAAVGIYGTLAYAVSRRRREIGVRVALGAPRGRVWGMVVGQGLRLALAGVALGVPAALLLTRWLEFLLFEVSATDPWIFSGVAAGVGGVALLASWIPAARATGLDPSETLRAE